MTNNDGYGRLARAKDWIKFVIWATADLLMVLWGGNHTHWGRDFFSNWK